MEQFGHGHEGQDPDLIENIPFADFDHNQLIACFPLKLREKYGKLLRLHVFLVKKYHMFYSWKIK